MGCFCSKPKAIEEEPTFSPVIVTFSQTPQSTIRSPGQSPVRSGSVPGTRHGSTRTGGSSLPRVAAPSSGRASVVHPSYPSKASRTASSLSTRGLDDRGVPDQRKVTPVWQGAENPFGVRKLRGALPSDWRKTPRYVFRTSS